MDREEQPGQAESSGLRKAGAPLAETLGELIAAEAAAAHMGTKTEWMAGLERDVVREVLAVLKKTRAGVGGKPTAEAVETMVADGVVAGMRATVHALFTAAVKRGE
jgi:hypothetical protein